MRNYLKLALYCYKKRKSYWTGKGLGWKTLVFVIVLLLELKSVPVNNNYVIVYRCSLHGLSAHGRLVERKLFKGWYIAWKYTKIPLSIYIFITLKCIYNIIQWVDVSISSFGWKLISSSTSASELINISTWYQEQWYNRWYSCNVNAKPKSAMI